MKKYKKYKLKDGPEIPALGFGTWELKGDAARTSVACALEVGYRHIDTADIYGNHVEVGRAIAFSGVPRRELFLTSKLWKTNLSKKEVLESTKRFLDELKTDYLDLLLIHWPNPKVPIAETLEAMEELKQKGLIKAKGVSNFVVDRLEDALATGIDISVNQVEIHPTLVQKNLVSFCQDKGIMVTAYSPIGQGKDLNLPIVKELSEKYGKPRSQVILNWIIGKGLVAIPRSAKREHIEENFGALAWDLEEADIDLIDKSDKNLRIIHPEFADFNLNL